MKEFFDKAVLFSKDLWFRLTVPKPLPPRVDALGQILPPPTPSEAQKILRDAVTNYVADGWNIEIENENENDVVLGRKAKFYWIGKLVLFLILLLLFAPLAIFYLIVVIVKGVTAKPERLYLWVDANGRIQRR